MVSDRTPRTRKKRWDKLAGRMTTDSHSKILRVHLFETMEDLRVKALDVEFQQDSDPKHTAKSITKWH